MTPALIALVYFHNFVMENVAKFQKLFYGSLFVLDFLNTFTCFQNYIALSNDNETHDDIAEHGSTSFNVSGPHKPTHCKVSKLSPPTFKKASHCKQITKS